jgi:hypothetical protein
MNSVVTLSDCPGCPKNKNIPELPEKKEEFIGVLESTCTKPQDLVASSPPLPRRSSSIRLPSTSMKEFIKRGGKKLKHKKPNDPDKPPK